MNIKQRLMVEVTIDDSLAVAYNNDAQLTELFEYGCNSPSGYIDMFDLLFGTDYCNFDMSISPEKVHEFMSKYIQIVVDEEGSLDELDVTVSVTPEIVGILNSDVGKAWMHNLMLIDLLNHIDNGEISITPTGEVVVADSIASINKACIDLYNSRY